MARPQFQLLTILEWVTGIAFLAALVAGAGGSASWTASFRAPLPRDDSRLRAWLDQQNRPDIQIERSGDAVTLKTTTTFLQRLRGRSGFDFPKVRWQDLGYPATTGFRGRTTWRPLSNSGRVWLTGLGLLLAFAWIRRRSLRERKGAKRQ